MATKQGASINDSTNYEDSDSSSDPETRKQRYASRRNYRLHKERYKTMKRSDGRPGLNTEDMMNMFR